MRLMSMGGREGSNLDIINTGIDTLGLTGQSALQFLTDGSKFETIG